MGETIQTPPTDIQSMLALIGKPVLYIRNHHKEGVLDGAGRIKAFGLDPEQRVIALIQDDTRQGVDGSPEVFNVPARCVNPSAAFREAFIELVKQVKEVEREGNAAARKVVDDANAKIQRMNDEVLGEALNFTTPDPQDGETA